MFQPSSLSDTVHEVVTESAEDARVAALCHVVCLNYILNPGGLNFTNVSMMNNGTGIRVAPMISVRLLLFVQWLFSELGYFYSILRKCT